MFSRLTRIGSVVAVTAVIGVAAPAHAVILHNATVTNNVIFGSGNANGGFTLSRDSGLELGLRTKVRFNGANQPENTFNSNGDGTFSFAAGQPAGGGFGFAPGSSSTAPGNFEWSVNSDHLGATGLNLDDLSYELGIDFDPGVGTNFLTFYPVNQTNSDNSIGTEATAAGAGVESNGSNYSSLIGNNSIAQNFWNMEFFDGGPFLFDANVGGIYDLYLSASDQGGELTRVEIQVIVEANVTEVAEPGILGLMGFGLAGLYFARRRRGI